MHKAPPLLITIGVALSLTVASATPDPPMPTTRQAIAHRGASGYAPEHTFAAYSMALEQHADFVEPDLAISQDCRLICLHDASLERTTNVEEVFPERYSRELPGRGGAKQSLANDFTLDEIKQLDAGSWMSDAYRGAKVPTWEEMIQLVRGKAGL